MAQLNVASRGGRNKRHKIHLDMTPMVDLAFLLLTFFVLTVTLNHAFVLKIEKPAESADIDNAPPVEADRVVTIILGGNNELYWYRGIVDPKLQRTDYSKNGIHKVIQDQRQQIPRMVLFIKPSSNCNYKNLVDILDEVTSSKLNEYYLVRETPMDKDLVLAMQHN